MQGFIVGQPVSIKVTWGATETPMVACEQVDGGIIAQTADAQGIITRWFVPYQAISYIKQVLSAADSGVGAVITAPVVVPPATGGGG